MFRNQSLFTPSQQFHMTADQFLDEAAVEYSTSQVARDLEVNTYKLFCDIIQTLEEEGKNC